LTYEGPLERWCGQDIIHNADGSVSLSQKYDVLSTIQDMPGIAEMRPVDSPMESNFTTMARKSEATEDNQPDLTFPYREAIGSALWYARRNFPTTLSAVTILAAHVSNPTRYHVKALKRVFKYLHCHAEDTITIVRDPNFDRANIQLTVFTDADWAADPLHRRSMSGYFIFMNHNLISSACKYHVTQCMSSMEAEYMGATFASMEMLFIYHLIGEFEEKIKIALPIPIFGDNTAALNFAEEQSINTKTKHIDLRHHFLKSLIDDDVTSMNYVCTKENLADILTKPLSIIDFQKFSEFITTTSRTAIISLFTKLHNLNRLRHKKL